MAPALGGLLMLGTALSCGGDALDPDRPDVASVTVQPSRLNVGVGSSSPLSAEARDAGGAVLRGRKIVWASKDPSVATVSASGAVTGVSPGTVQVAASVEGKSAIADVTVSPKSVASVRLTPAGDLRLLVGEGKQMTADALDADGAVLPGRPISWSSNTTSIATVSATGLVTAIAPGGAIITAASEGKTALVAVTVSSVPVASVSVTPASDTLVVTQTLQLTAVAKDVQGGTLAGRPMSWSTSDATKATVSSSGLVTGVSPGEVTITASSEGKAGTAAITIKPKPVGAVILSPAQFTLEVGLARQLTAQVTDDAGNVLTGRTVAYATSDAAIATVSSSGVVTGVAVGSTKITATSEGKSGTADVTVTTVPVATVEVAPSNADITVGQTVALTATAKDARGNVVAGRPVAWTSGAPSVATVSAAGVVTAVGAGSAVIFATIDGRSGSAAVNVRRLAVTNVAVAPSSSNITVGGAVQLNATVQSGSTVLTDRVVGWSSSNEAVAVVSSTGRVTGLKAGVVTITATSEGVSGTAFVAVGVTSVVVTPNPTSVTVGQSRQLTAVARDASNATISGVSFQWSSASSSIVTVDATGLITGRAPGTANVTASVGNVSGASSVTVTQVPVASVTVTPSTASVDRGKTVQLSVTLKDAGGHELTGRVVTWTSSNTLVATVSSTGLVTASALLTGNVKITATSEGKSDNATITVK